MDKDTVPQEASTNCCFCPPCIATRSDHRTTRYAIRYITLMVAVGLVTIFLIHAANITYAVVRMKVTHSQ